MFVDGSGDIGLVSHLKQILQRHAHGDHFTIVMATPVPELVEELADRVAVIKSGEIIAYDTIENLRRASGAAGKLDDVYEKLVSPDTAGKIERYFDAVEAKS